MPPFRRDAIARGAPVFRRHSLASAGAVYFMPEGQLGAHEVARRFASFWRLLRADGFSEAFLLHLESSNGRGARRGVSRRELNIAGTLGITTNHRQNMPASAFTADAIMAAVPIS